LCSLHQGAVLFLLVLLVLVLLLVLLVLLVLVWPFHLRLPHEPARATLRVRLEAVVLVVVVVENPLTRANLRCRLSANLPSSNLGANNSHITHNSKCKCHQHQPNQNQQTP
jgi:hypothetical protein